eukprot:981457-Rhodomonas_salina.3
MSENPLHRKYSRHIDTRMYYVRDLMRDGVVKLSNLKVAGPRNVADANTKSLPGPAFQQHLEYMWGTRVPFQAFFSRVVPTRRTGTDPPPDRACSVISTHYVGP